MSSMLKASGLHTFTNDLDAVPNGALLKAENTVIDRDGVIESRRGLRQYADIHATPSDRAKQLFEYKDRMLVHYANKLAFDNGVGVLTDFDGSYNELDPGLRIKGLEANSNFYFTTTDGIKKISAKNNGDFTNAAGFITDAGGIEALDINGIPNYSIPGFFLPQSKVAYRVVWAYYDNNDNLLLGSPSSGSIVTNAAPSPVNIGDNENTAIVDLTFAIPQEIGTNTKYFYQIYRTPLAQKGILPSLDDIITGEDYYLVLEDYPTPAQLTAGLIQIQDVTPEDFRQSGTPLYTNANSGEGILQANTPPPIAKDIAMFQGSVFYANTQTEQTLFLDMLSVSQLVSEVSSITITDGVNSNTYTFQGSPEVTEITFDSVANTTQLGYFLINSAGNERKYQIWADKIGNSVPPTGVDTDGRIPLKVDLSYGEVDDTVDGLVGWGGGSFSISNTQGEEATPHKTEITFDTFANTTDGGYFIISSEKNAQSFFVWADKTGTTPQPSTPDTIGRLPLRVDLTGAVTDDDVADAVEAELLSLGLFSVSSAGPTLTIDTVITNYDVADRVAQVLISTNDFQVNRNINELTITTSNNGYTDNSVDGATGWGGPLFDITVVDQGIGEDIANRKVLLSGASTPAQQIDETSRSLIRVINQNPNEVVYAFYQSNEADLPGKIYFQARDISNPPFYIYANDTATASQFNPKLSVLQTGATVSTGTNLVTVTLVTHGYQNGDRVILSNATTTPNISGSYVISNVTANTFDINATVTIAGTVNLGSSDDVFSTNEVKPNRIYFSKYQQPEAVPIVNYIDIGPKDKAILRILALRDSLFIFKEEAIYMLTGNIAPDWVVKLFDSSVLLLAPDTATILNNQIYALTTQGVARVTDTGAGVISRPIEDKIQKIIYQNPNFKTASFGVSYETDRSYLLFVPYAKGDVEATLCLRFNSFTQSWTEWSRNEVSGLVMSHDDKLYLGASSNIIEQERKNLDRTDYADYEFVKTMGPNAIDNKTIILNSNLGMKEGDVITQRQYLTISTYNRLLSKLDMDVGLTFHNYKEDLELKAGDNLTNAMINLVLKLNTDPSTQLTYTFNVTTNPILIQQEYNIVIDTLNVDPGVHMADYRQSNITKVIESRIMSVVNNTNKVVVDEVAPFLQGELIHYVGIETDIIYTPQDFNDPSLYKQISEGTFIFEDSVFTSAIAGYNSDLSPSFDFIPFTADGDGSWGNFTWSNQSWGGEGDQVPLRTLIPREKQRCRFLRPRFIHKNAWEHYALFGISFNPRVYSTRSYR